MKRLIRQLKWRWILIGALLIIGRFTLVWAGNVSTLIEDTGTNVGIGTTGPGHKLDVQDTTGGQIVNVQGPSATIAIRGTTPGGIGLNIYNSSGTLKAGLSYSPTSDIAFMGYGGNAYVSINSSGNVGIGTTSPGRTLEVAGNLGVKVNANAGGHAQIAFAQGGTEKAYLTYWNTFGTLGLTSGSGVDGIHFQPTTGNVGIGTTSPATKFHVAGDVQVDGNLAAKYQDVAEWVQTSGPLTPGTVVVVNPQGRNQILPASQSYDTRVAGVVSAKPGLLLGEAGEGKVKVAQSGRVKVKVDAAYGPIMAGDLLVTSPSPGHAMRSSPVKLGETLIHRPGTLLGKALEPLEEGQGEILVLLTLQ